MLLIGTTAAGLALARAMLDHTTRMRRDPTWIIETINYLLLVWTAGFLVLRLWEPRPVPRRLICQPGMAACTAALLVTAFDTTTWAIHWALLDPRMNCSGCCSRPCTGRPTPTTSARPLPSRGSGSC